MVSMKTALTHPSWDLASTHYSDSLTLERAIIDTYIELFTVFSKLDYTL